MKLITFTILILTTNCGMFAWLIDTKSVGWLFIWTTVLVNKRVINIKVWFGIEHSWMFK